MEISDPYAGILVYSLFSLVLASLYFCWVSYLAYPNLFGNKDLMLLFVVAMVKSTDFRKSSK
jgi:hypothetical protein